MAEQTVKNVLTEITSFDGSDDVVVVGSYGSYSVAVSVLRAVLDITEANPNDDAYILSIKLQGGSGNAQTVRRLGILPDTVSGKFIDIITQFSPTSGWALGANESISLSVSPPLQGSDKIVVFALTGEEPLPVVA